MRSLALSLFFLVAMTGIWNRDLWNPHEYRDGAIALEMARSRDFVVPTLGGKPFLEKPPLFYATGALLENVLGTEPARTIRTASLLFAVATQVAVYLTARMLHGARSALFACGVLASSLGFYQLGHTIVTDIGLLFFIALAMLGFVWFAFAGHERGRELLALGMAGAFLCKGLIGCALPAVAILAFSLATKSPGLLWRTISWPGLLIFAAGLAAWLAPLAQRDGGVHLRTWLDENVGRYFGSDKQDFHHEQPIYYYLGAMPYLCVPWCFCWPFALLRWFRSGRPRPSRAALLLMAWGVGGLILMSLAITKRDIYAGPLIPAFAMMLAPWLTTSAGSTFARVSAIGVASCAAIAVLAGAVLQVGGWFGTPGWPAVLTLSLPVSLAALWLARRASSDTALAAIAAPAALLVQLNVLAAPAVNPRMSFRDPILRIADHLPVAREVMSWRLGETRIGGFSFYADRRFRDFIWEPALRRNLKRHPDAYLLADPERLQQANLSDSFVTVYRDWLGSDDLDLYRQK